MSNFKKVSVFFAVSAFALSGLALAGPKADTNNDGQITQAEFQAAADTKFSQADTDFDGNLTKDEMMALKALKRAERQAAKFAHQDLNGDGALTQEEIETARAAKEAKMQARRLERLDTNQNGTIEDSERDAMKAERRSKHEAKKAEREAYGSSSETGERKGKSGKRGMHGPKKDTNGDGLISRAEYNAASNALFIRMDANGDGVLTKGEGKKRRGRKGKRKH